MHEYAFFCMDKMSVSLKYSTKAKSCMLTAGTCEYVKTSCHSSGMAKMSVSLKYCRKAKNCMLTLFRANNKFLRKKTALQSV